MMVRIFFILIISFSIEIYAQDGDFIPLEDQMRNEQLIRNLIKKKKGKKTVEEYPGLLIVYWMSLKSEYDLGKISDLYLFKEVEIVDGLLLEGKSFLDIVNPIYSSKKKKKEPDPLISSFIIYKDSMNILCEGDRGMRLCTSSSEGK